MTGLDNKNQETFARTFCGRKFRPQNNMPDVDLLGFNCLEFEAIRIKRLVFEHFHDVTKIIGRGSNGQKEKMLYLHPRIHSNTGGWVKSGRTKG